jgi:hypothetical protein
MLLQYTIVSVIQVASHLYPSRIFINIFGNWLRYIDHKYKILVRAGAVVVHK